MLLQMIFDIWIIIGLHRPFPGYEVDLRVYVVPFAPHWYKYQC